jgi:hypothetical protein
VSDGTAPDWPEDGQRVYVIALSSGIVKAGRTSNACKRARQLAGEARSHGASIVKSWVSPAHENVRPNERALLAYCKRNGRAMTKEYFTGLDFAATVRFAESLTFEDPAPPLPEENLSSFDYWMEDHPLTVESLIWQVLKGDLILIDPKRGILDLATDAEVHALRKMKDARHWAGK